MPLAFTSKSHGTVAFGFFNIETDMLLLGNLFFFAGEFCRAVVDLHRGGASRLSGWRIPDHRHIGDLHGAIAGRNLSGFIGETYRLFPFPVRQEDFKQSPEGFRNRGCIEEKMARYGERVELDLAREGGSGDVHIGEFVFDAGGFDALVDYVDRGGYPRWRDETRPDYVQAMMAELGGRTDPPVDSP
jgi:hypothetical protein